VVVVCGFEGCAISWLVASRGMELEEELDWRLTGGELAQSGDKACFSCGIAW
jgi:hypothetical protein